MIVCFHGILQLTCSLLVKYACLHLTILYLYQVFYSLQNIFVGILQLITQCWLYLAVYSLQYIYLVFNNILNIVLIFYILLLSTFSIQLFTAYSTYFWFSTAYRTYFWIFYSLLLNAGYIWLSTA